MNSFGESDEARDCWIDWVGELVTAHLAEIGHAGAEALAYEHEPVNAAEWREQSYDVPSLKEWSEFLREECFDGVEGLAEHFQIDTDPKGYSL